MKYELSEDGKQIIDTITNEPAPDLKTITDALNNYHEELDEYKAQFGDINFETANTIEEWFTLWNRYVYELTEKEHELLDLKESYAQMEEKIINETDFKELYGKNNETVRKNHVKRELKDLVDERHDFELRISFLKRRISYIKSLMSMQKTLLKCGSVE